MIELSFESGEDSLSVRRFSVREAVSTLFEVEIEARSPNEELDLEGLVGKGAALRAGGRAFRGVCCAVEQTRAEPSGLSTYAVRLVPTLWLLTQRRNYRLFQHLSALGIARAVLAEWSVEAAFHVDEARHPRLEVRVQYGETDFDFVSRLLEDAGIAFVFPEGEDAPPLLLTDDLFAAKASGAAPIPYVDDASAAREHDHVTEVRLAHEVRPGRLTIRDTDFRRSPAYQLLGSAASGSREDRFEHYHYRPGSFLVEPAASAASDAGGARHDEKEGQKQAERRLGSLRSSRRAVSFHTSVALWPGAIFSMSGHPRADLAAARDLVVTELVTEGTAAGVTTRSGRAAFVGAGEAWLPPLRAPRPRVNGVQSAVVVGPPGQEIHTDELGRVRVQFPWDREGRFDEQSSCWLRVSQGWAGGAFGMMALPRVGQEVLVEFVEGDPDQPVVVGRVYSGTNQVPYKLPEHRTVSGWKSASSPGGNGSNEILFEDAKGGERLFVQAERDLERLIKRDEATTVGNDRSDRIAGDDTVAVGGGRSATIGDADVILVGARHAVSVAATTALGASTGSEIVDGRISFTTGQATLTLEGPNITLDAAAGILLKAATDIALMAEAHITARADVSLTLAAGATLVVRSEGGDVVIQGGPNVLLNPEIIDRAALSAAGAEPGVAVPPGVDLDDDIALAEEHARFDPAAPSWFDDQMKPGGPWDYARLGPQYAPFASFHYGVMGRAVGFPEGALLHQAGVRRRAQGDARPEWGEPGNGISGGTYPYGADPRDQEMTRKGFASYARRYG
jgi:type VI secretion system secreted protein VgrG